MMLYTYLLYKSVRIQDQKVATEIWKDFFVVVALSMSVPFYKY